jgi:hypothetical protein
MVWHGTVLNGRNIQEEEDAEDRYALDTIVNTTSWTVQYISPEFSRSMLRCDAEWYARAVGGGALRYGTVR